MYLLLFRTSKAHSRRHKSPPTLNFYILLLAFLKSFQISHFSPFFLRFSFSHRPPNILEINKLSCC